MPNSIYSCTTNMASLPQRPHVATTPMHNFYGAMGASNGLLPLTQLPPPPPPPNPPEPAALLYSGPHRPQAVFNVPTHKQLPMFDVSKPPPSIQAKKTFCNAGANKNIRPEDQNAANTKQECKECLQREPRMLKYQEEIDWLSTAEECEVMRYKETLEECQAKKELCRLLMDDLDNCAEAHSMRLEDLMPSLAQTSPPTLAPARPQGASNSINIEKLLEFVKSNETSPKWSLEPGSSTSSTLQQITNVKKSDSAPQITPSTGVYGAVVAPYNNHTNAASAVVSAPARAHAAPSNVNYAAYHQTMPPSTPLQTYYNYGSQYPCTSSSAMEGYGSVRANMSASQGPTTHTPQPVATYKRYTSHNNNNYTYESHNNNNNTYQSHNNNNTYESHNNNNNTYQSHNNNNNTYESHNNNNTYTSGRHNQNYYHPYY